MSLHIATRSETAEDPIPCMIAIRPSDGAVSVLPLLETPIGLAIYEGDTYRRIGQVRHIAWTEPGRKKDTVVKRKGVAWFFDDPEYGQDQGRELTQKAAVAALLKAGGYIEAPANAANPGLFS